VHRRIAAEDVAHLPVGTFFWVCAAPDYASLWECHAQTEMRHVAVCRRTAWTVRSPDKPSAVGRTKGAVWDGRYYRVARGRSAAIRMALEHGVSVETLAKIALPPGWTS
jgi:hypothetical protein